MQVGEGGRPSQLLAQVRGELAEYNEICVSSAQMASAVTFQPIHCVLGSQKTWLK